MIEMSLERHNPQAVTRSKEQSEPEELTMLVIPGRIYAIRADIRDYEAGFCIVRANQSSTGVFHGVYLDQTSDQNENSTVCFKETNHIGRFYFGTIVCEIISAINVRNIVHINADEIEDIIVSANVDN